MNRILLLLDHKENRRLLAEWLAQHHEVVIPAEGREPEGPFDLCILDGHALDRERAWARRQVEAQAPVFLPFLLITSRRGVGMVTQHLWEEVHDTIVSPIEKAELQARVENLLHTRRLSLENAALARRLAQELSRAATVQAELLPRDPPALPGFELAARCIPAREVGGDFYDWQELAPGRVSVTLGDAMGKGMSAALLMATVRAALRAVAPAASGPAEAATLTRRALETELERAGSLVTLFHGQIDAGTRRFSYVDAGHGDVLLRRASGRVEKLKHGGPALGIPVPAEYEEGSFVFEIGDTLAIYSDALVESRPEEMLSSSALAAVLKDAPHARVMIDRLVALASAAGPPTDDLTVVVLRCTGEPTPPARGAGAVCMDATR